MIKIEALYFKYDTDNFEVNIESLHFSRGGIHCLIGPNGSGKTSLLSLLAGLFPPAKGRISINNMDYASNRIEIYEKAFFSIDQPGFYGNMNAYDNLEIHCLYRKKSASNISEILKLMELRNDGKKYKNYSTGMKQKLNIAASLLHNPQLIVLDEPFNALDPGAVINIKAIFQKFNRELGTTFVISTHLIKEAESFCTHFLMMKDGQIVLQDSMASASNGLEIEYKKVFLS